ncbi:hypothetical protein [Lactobacillus sp. LL6]|uniref:hypothetical protein n=1 Tax=Lactobacillus sp. LL6 TaxID=2596827 RepID=UPI0011856E86|nr:hypothetical protein [Lactobacillus sp. LL6]TSO25308.1 hypothetical protein FOD82_08700 [Lactobacillus sp. LL6]
MAPSDIIFGFICLLFFVILACLALIASLADRVKHLEQMNHKISYKLNSVSRQQETSIDLIEKIKEGMHEKGSDIQEKFRFHDAILADLLKKDIKKTEE